ADVEEPPEKHEVLLGADRVVDRGLLSGETDSQSHPAGMPGDVEAGDFGRAAVGSDERAQDAYGRGFAGTVRAEQPVDHPVGHREIETVESEGLLVALSESGRSYRKVGHGSPSI